MRRTILSRAVLAGSTLAVAGATALLPTPARAAATITPGVQTFTGGAQCTANFVFSDGVDTLIGQAAHCAGTGGNTETDGCTAGTLPEGTPVEITGATRPGRIVYSSWVRMQAAGETDPDTCAYNDIALVRVDPADAGSVSASVSRFGGPTGLNTTGTVLGDTVYTYGNSELRLGLSPLSPKRGASLGDAGGGWTHQVYTVTPGIPGDSGSAFLDADGRALGVLSTLAIAPFPGENNVSDLAHMLGYAHSHGQPGVQLRTGGPFDPGYGLVV